MTEHTPQNDNAATDDNGKVVSKLLFVVVGMFAFGFALVPIYEVFCDITGLNGKTADEAIVLTEGAHIDTSREVTVEFIASLNANMPWEFEPVTKAVKVHPGQSMQVDYIARNTAGHAIIGNAVPSVSPGQAAAYFLKTECFCFTEQKLESAEEKTMPVIFVVDPELPEDVNTLTLSYTFFVKPGTETVSMVQY